MRTVRWILAVLAGCGHEYGDPFASAGDGGGSTASDGSGTTSGATTTSEASVSGAASGDTSTSSAEGTDASTSSAAESVGSGDTGDGSGSDGSSTGEPCRSIELLFDAGFEGGHPNPDWAEVSSAPNKTQIICSGECTVDMSSLAYAGLWWAWFGANGAIPTTDTVSQPFDAPDGGPLVLTFYLRLVVPGGVGGGADTFAVDIDGEEVFAISDLAAETYADYTLVEVDVGAHADGGAHTITFTGDYVTAGGALLDEVRLTGCV